MLDDLNELKTFQKVLGTGSLSGAARALGVSLAVVSKRLLTLEARIGARLVNRTTRSLSPTEEGARLLIDVERALDALRQAEETLATGRLEPVGLLRVTAPVSFGRRHVAPVLGELTNHFPQLLVSLTLEDRVIDLAGEAVDVAIRIGALADTSAVMRKLADNRRILLAAPKYLAQAGMPQTPDDLATHAFLRYGGTTAPFRLLHPGGLSATIDGQSRLRVDDGDAVHDWCLAGYGIMLKSQIDVADEMASGALIHVLPEWSGGDAPVVALFPTARHLPLKVRVFVDAMAAALLPIGRRSASASHQHGER